MFFPFSTERCNEQHHFKDPCRSVNCEKLFLQFDPQKHSEKSWDQIPVLVGETIDSPTNLTV